MKTKDINFSGKIVAGLMRQNIELNLNLKSSAKSISRYEALINASPDIIYSCDVFGRLTTVNRKFCETLGLKSCDILGRRIFSLEEIKNVHHVWKKSFVSIRSDMKPLSFEFELKTADETVHTYTSFLTPVLDSDNRLYEIAGTWHDITEIKKNELQIGRLVNYDPLTDLPNRLLLIDRLNIAIHHAKRSGKNLAVIFLDFDNFKKINDTLGHFTGNEFIRIISKELNAVLRKDETLARLGGDEFVIFIQGAKDKDDILSFIERIRKVFQCSYYIGQNIIHVSSSMGVAIFPDNGESCEELINNADTAMYKAKELGKNNVQFYSSNMKDEVFRRLALEGHLGNALKKDEFYLCYQPQIETYSGRIRGFEALIRWNSPIGPVSPSDFIGLAEETELIIPIGEWVLRTACKKNREWQIQYKCNTIISVNVSVIQLKQANFSETVLSILNETGMEAEFLELEITESVLINSFKNISATLEQLKASGIKISLDDFGTGYSSLNYLRKLPLNTLKIDRSFIKNIHDSSIESEIVQTIIQLVHKFGLEIVAEGIETKEQLVYITDARCDYMQGFLLSRPTEAGNIPALLNNGKINLTEMMEEYFEKQFI